MWIACSGLGSVARGFESFSRECFDALKGRNDLEVTLFKGRGPAPLGERRLWTPVRDGRLARAAGAVVRRSAYEVEQAFFALRLAPWITARRPDLVFFSDWMLGVALMKWRAVSGHRFRLLFSNGGPLAPPYPFADHVQQLTPGAFEYALHAGEPADRQTLLPLGIDTRATFAPSGEAERRSLRRKLSLPEDGAILLSVAALNSWHKRLDYVVSELASLPRHRRPHLVLLGHPEEETAAVLSLARSLLGPDGFTVRTVPLSAVGDFYRAADTFVLASTFEAMGRAFLEALSHGLPVLAHDFHVTRFVLGRHGYLADLTKPGGLTRLLASLGEPDHSEERSRERHRHVYENFSWDVLRPPYVALLTAVAGRERSPAGPGREVRRRL